MKLRQASLGFLIKDDKILLAMKKRGFGMGKWNGVGGKPDANESIEEASIREVMEEIGVEVVSQEVVAELDFYFKNKSEWDQQVIVFKINEWKNEPQESEEMAPMWYELKDIPYDKMWVDDIYWLPKMLDGQKIKAKFVFGDNDEILEMEVNNLNGEKIILVDENDKQIGESEKMKAHQNGGKKHRAFSILIFNNKGEVMLQQRALSKYHCGGMWTNTVCSHPFVGEEVEAAAHRRLKEEMGFDTELAKIMEFNYEAKVNNELTENEYDHVFVGEYNGEPILNKNEAENWKWISKKDLDEDMAKNPEKYTVWFRIIWEELNKTPLSR